MNNTQRYLALCTAIAMLAAAPAHKSPRLPREIPDALTHHVAQVGGQSIPYTARAGTLTLKNDKEEVTARLFYVAYTKDGADLNKRPVTFFYNGGPGSSSVWLHMGSYSPVKVVTVNGAPTGPAPFKMVNNTQSLIDKTDEVFIDAPNTGYSRVIGKGDPKDFMGVDQDGRAFTQFIQRYLSKYNRWNSPKILFGESYGTTRDCVLVNMLQHAGVEMNGVVLLSSILNFGLGTLNGGQPIAGGDWAYMLYLPTEAATAWYHHKASSGGQSLPVFLKNVERFASGEYMHALAQGSDLSPAESDRIVSALHGYLGLSPQYIRESNLRIPYRRYSKELLRNENQIVGRYDSRFTTHDIDGAAESPSWDPSDVAMSGAFVGQFNQYIRQTLNYDSNLQYRPTSYGGQLGARWDFKHNGNDPPTNVAPDLAEAMSSNPHLRVFSGNGDYDFATPYYATVYTLEHLQIAPDLQKHITYGFYPSGHMVYLNPSAQAKFKSDLSKWYDTATNGR
ncbi:MAG: peptidase S10 [Candidatus Eremiobacteraeota bacterium]|nr:peptidase S10 [Candidatus Eremiobacteraeota bacterium]